MKQSILILMFLVFCLSCQKKDEVSFSDKVLKSSFVSLENETTTLEEILNQYKGKKILIDVWASWCGDCIKGLPALVKVQKQYPNTVYLFLSIDESLEDLKTGIAKYGLSGEHYLSPSGWKGDFSEFLDLDWIPRYLLINESGTIEVFNAVKANDKRILKAIKK